MYKGGPQLNDNYCNSHSPIRKQTGEKWQNAGGKYLTVAVITQRPFNWKLAINSRLGQGWCDCVLECRFLPLGKPRREVGGPVKAANQREISPDDWEERKKVPEIYIQHPKSTEMPRLLHVHLCITRVLCGSTLPSHISSYLHFLHDNKVKNEVNNVMK